MAGRTKGQKIRIGISPSPKLLAWVDAHVGEGKRFANRTHAFEAGIARLMQSDSQGRV